MKVILGISGSIAAYKAANLTRLLIKKGAHVQVLMTTAATDFISPLTLATLSKNPALTDVHTESGWNNHVDLGLWADAYVIAPATANTLAKLANGLCDNILSAVYLSARCPVFVAPAMDVDMWRHPATQQNVQKLKSYGVHVIPVGHGELASGLVGDGRMAEPEEIIHFLDQHFSEAVLKGKKALVTAGPTHEPLDPVRFLGNHSTGKMGIAIADQLALLGADVTLVLGPTHLSAKHPGVKTILAETAQDMHDACMPVFPSSDITVLAAAVADYKPKQFSNTKIKKKDDDLQIDLSKTIDIAAALGKQKKPGQMLVGFALETNDEAKNAALKLEKKNLDFIVLNSMNDAGAGFGHDTNKITMLFRDGRNKEFPLKSKKEVASDIVAEIIELSRSLQPT
ncbi:MAG: bifunctional phosphopantothenoylcysteine decarboxylase/phosphopantothenate--cysteine ligase CoaBC [Saprospiraceae bacterium]|nr:bifunctional phosphopantothenoylcysteine decarboxylase/phosphopantothenate--cysteine ligase CoaBC [Saprospiraceae bacterium]